MTDLQNISPQALRKKFEKKKSQDIQAGWQKVTFKPMSLFYLQNMHMIFKILFQKSENLPIARRLRSRRSQLFQIRQRCRYHYRRRRLPRL